MLALFIKKAANIFEMSAAILCRSGPNGFLPKNFLLPQKTTVLLSVQVRDGMC